MKKLLFNPFEKYDARALLFIGLLAILPGALLAFLFGAHYNGALDMHIGHGTTFVLAFTENVFAIAFLFVGLYIFSYIINKKTRPVDILSTVLIARIPLYITTLAGIGGVMTELETTISEKGPNAVNDMLPELIPVLLISLLLIPLVIWFFALLYNGVKTASNLKTTQHKVMFAVTIIIIEIVSLLIFPILYQ
jgi:hypothetical protein